MLQLKLLTSIEFDWFHKPMFSERYLNFFSLHPLSKTWHSYWYNGSSVFIFTS